MQTRFGQVQDLSSTQSEAQTMTRNGNGTTIKEIPYDYVATFNLEGRRGHRVHDVINISVEGAFVAVAIGYSFIPAKIDTGKPSPTPVPASVSSFLLALTQPVATQPGVDERLLAQCLMARFCGINFKIVIIESIILLRV